METIVGERGQVRYGDKWAVATWVRELDQKQQRSAIEDRQGDLTAGACAAGDRERNGVWSRVQVRKRRKPTQRLQDGETKIYRVPSLDFVVIGLTPNILKPRL